jgi:hypothetical protein
MDKESASLYSLAHWHINTLTYSTQSKNFIHSQTLSFLKLLINNFIPQHFGANFRKTTKRFFYI